MAAANIRASWFGLSAAEPAGLNAETGLSLDRSEAQGGVEPLPIPLTPPNTVFSAVKQVALQVLGVGTTTISNGTVRAAGAMPNGAAWFWQASATYLAQLSNFGALTTFAGAGTSTLISTVTFATNDLVQIDVGVLSELRLVVSVSGGGPYTLSIDRALASSHAVAAQVARFVSSGPADVLTEAAGNQPSTPASYTRPTTTAVQYDVLGLATTSLGRKGPFIRLVGGVATAYGNNPGVVTLPAMIIGYDEA